MGAPAVSVVVPTFNRVGMLRQSLAAILAQTWRDFEIVVVDNMSEDGTQDYVRSLAPAPVRYLRNPNNGVIAVNRNLGVRAARGRYVAFCDDDDLWRADKLARQMALMQARPEVALCYTAAEYFIDGGRSWQRGVRNAVREDHFRHLLSRNFISNSSVLIRKDVLDELGPLNVDPDVKGCEDYEYWLRVSYRHPIACIAEPLLRYRIHPDAISVSRTRETARSIRVVKALARELGLGWSRIALPLLIQYAKLGIYRLGRR